MGNLEFLESEDSSIETENEDKHKHTSHDNDILVVGLWGPACNNVKRDKTNGPFGKDSIH